MARKQRQEDGGGNEWMNTYSDLVTLLMTFFVLLFSMSSVNAEKWEKFIKALSNPGDDTSQIVIDAQNPEDGDGPLPNQSDDQAIDELPPDMETAPLPVDFSDLYAYLQNYVEEIGLGESVEVTEGGDNVVYIRFKNNIFFDPDRYYLRPAATELLGFVGDCIHNVEDQIYIVSINGHTAAVPYDNGVSDWRLSSERASSVAIFLEEQKGVSPQKLRPIGYGKNFPAVPNDSPEGREENRRVDMIIVKGNADGSSSLLESELSSLFDPSQFPTSGGTTDILTPET